MKHVFFGVRAVTFKYMFVAFNIITVINKQLELSKVQLLLRTFKAKSLLPYCLLFAEEVILDGVSPSRSSLLEGDVTHSPLYPPWTHKVEIGRALS